MSFNHNKFMSSGITCCETENTTSRVDVLSGRLCTGLSNAIDATFLTGTIPTSIIPKDIYGSLTLPTLRAGDVYRLTLTGDVHVHDTNRITFNIPNVMYNAKIDLTTAPTSDFEIEITIHVRKASKLLTEFYTFLKMSTFGEEPFGNAQLNQFKTSIQTLQMEELPIVNIDLTVQYAIYVSANDHILCTSMVLEKL
jgi:hypothetical protein